MSSRFLPAFVEDLDDVLRSTVPHLVAGRLPVFRVLDMCTAFRRRGIARFLMTADPAPFHIDVHRSATALCAHLASGQRDVLLSSQAAPWFDALASNDPSAVASIAARAHPSPILNEEYEEDFCYMRFLFALVRGSATRDELGRLIQRQFELDVRGGSPRAFLCKAMFEHDEKAFGTALETLIESRVEDYTSGMQTERVLEIEWSTEGQVFVEGIALLKIAAACGLSIPSTFRFIPDVLLPASSLLLEADDWARPDDLPRWMPTP